MIMQGYFLIINYVDLGRKEGESAVRISAWILWLATPTPYLHHENTLLGAIYNEPPTCLLKDQGSKMVAMEAST